jgi:4-hydroxy-tetrahydrodipicolinate synthase
MAEGGDGVISVTSNALPRLVSSLAEAMLNGDLDEARRLSALLAPFTVAAFIESNPIPVKAALAMMGRIENVLRLPLVPLKESLMHTVEESLSVAGAVAGA